MEWCFKAATSSIRTGQVGQERAVWRETLEGRVARELGLQPVPADQRIARLHQVGCHGILPARQDEADGEGVQSKREGGDHQLCLLRRFQHLRRVGSAEGLLGVEQT